MLNCLFPLAAVASAWVRFRASGGAGSIWLGKWYLTGGSKDATDSNPAQGVKMTRPLCPYPQVAKYKGTGDTNDAANFVCAPGDKWFLAPHT